MRSVWTVTTSKSYTDTLWGDYVKKIAEIVENIRAELEGATEYAKKATQYKEPDRALSEAYASLATAELEHVDKLHAQAVRLIKEQSAAGKEAPAGMQAVWDWEHEKMVDHVARVKTMLDMYRR